MKRVLPAISLILLGSTAIISQTVTPTPPSDPDVVRISTNLIQLDVTVTDSKGKIVTDLRPEEIEIYENGKRQKTTNFSFISNIRAETPKIKTADKDKTNTLVLPPPPAKPENVRRAIALVVDDLNLSFTSTYWVKEALKKFVNEQMLDGDLVAILKTGSGIGALQQFTTDKRLLLAAIQKVRFNMLGSGKIGSFNPIEPTLKEQLDGSDGKDFSEDIEDERDFEREVGAFRESIFAAGTLGAVNFIIRGMRELPGRKSIVLLSDGFSLTERDSRGVPSGMSRVLNPMRNLTDLANRSSVVIYTIDPRGLEYTGLTAADNTFGLTPEQIDERIASRSDELRDTQDGLVYLARETGGFAIINQNDVSRGIRRVLDDQSYYLVGYEPDDDIFDPKTRRYNKLEIKVLRKDTKVRYRSGFFGISDEQIAKPTTSPGQTLYNALTSPFGVNDISVKVNALFGTAPKAAGYLRSFLHIDAKNLTFVKEPDGQYKTSFDMMAATYGEDGPERDRLSKNFTITLPPIVYETVQRNGLVYNFTFFIKNAGAFQMRVAVRDTATNRVGSANQFIEVPNLKKKRLSLSGVALENLTFAQWQKRGSMTLEEAAKLGDPIRDTAVRQFDPGTVLSYALNIFNAKNDSNGRLDLTLQAKLFSDQKLIFEGKTTSVETAADRKDILAKGSFRLGTAMAAGNYTLQVIVTDNNAKKGRNIVYQFVSFEIVK